MYITIGLLLPIYLAVISQTIWYFHVCVIVYADERRRAARAPPGPYLHAGHHRAIMYLRGVTNANTHSLRAG